MKVLLLGEYSNVHHTLGEALRRAGHEVLLVSDGDGWKDYPRDVDLRRMQPGPVGSLRYLTHLATLLPRMRGWDVVQVINPIFLDVKARWNRWMLGYLKRHNRLLSVGCFGDDYYVIKRMMDPACFDYTDLQVGGQPVAHATNARRIDTWLHTDKAALTQYAMQRADCLVACLYEYWKVYNVPGFAQKLHYIALPMQVEEAGASHVDATPGGGTAPATPAEAHGQVTHILFAAQRLRKQMKGTDLLEPLLDRLATEYPDRVRVSKVESVPFAEYQRLVAEADVVVDQLYSYTPAMGALESLRQGKVVISGYETEYARFLQGQNAGVEVPEEETGIINLRPMDDEVNYAKLVRCLTQPETVARMKRAGRQFVSRWHDADRVAQRYIEVWSSAMGVGVVSSSSSRSSQR